MPVDLNNGVAGSGLALSALIYVGASMYVTGPLVMERTIEKSGWVSQCERRLQDDMRRSQAPAPSVPSIDCRSVLDAMGPEMRRMLEVLGGNAACQIIDQKKRQQELIEDLKQQRFEASLSGAESRCRCAVSGLIEQKRSAFALYAGSARIVTPSAVRSLSSELEATLHAPACAAMTNKERAS